MPPRPLFAFLLALAGWTATAFAQPAPLPSGALDGLAFRNIGPAVTGGRIHDVEALPTDPGTLYVATASGGLWKSTNKGTTWTPIFDDQAVSTFGDVAIAPSDPDVIWAGTGEQQNRQSTSWGNGVYRSIDGGRTWHHLGLDTTRHIGRIRVHPDDPDIAYVAAPGNLWKADATRGVFKTTDGGATWEKVLFIDEDTGVIDLAMDPGHPDILYAAAYQRRRRTWGFNGGGPGSGIYKTTDGGVSWTALTRGLPDGDKGRIGLALAPSNPNVLYATIEHAKEPGTYRSNDGGASWEKVNPLNPRPMYYSHIVADPTDENRVYLLATEFYRSDDGGRTFRQMPTRPTYDMGIHSDFHTLWIDPHNTSHFYLAGDGGLTESWDRGETYLRINNLPIGQFYAIGVDMHRPYRIYGGMQDNHSWVGPSASRRWIGIIDDDWRQVGFGDGMYQQPDPTGPYVYVNAQNGELTRLDPGTGDLLDIRPHPPAGEAPYRFDWVTPSLISPHDPRTVYFGGNRLFISHDRGVSWTATGDLTRQIDRDSLFLMGVQGKDIRLSKNDGTASFGEITTIAASPVDPRVLWVGTDDGNVQVSQDGGATWTETSRNASGVPDGTYVSRVLASAAGPGVAYAAFDAHRDGDWRPFLARTTDFGKTWTLRIDGLPEEGSINALVEYPGRPGLLFLGTERALFTSTDAGDHWTRIRANLPTTLFDDLLIHPREGDLIVATHGRSIWILDDIAPLASWTAATAGAPATLFPIRPATLFFYWKATSYRGQNAFNGENPAFGAYFNYYLTAPTDSVHLVIHDTTGQEVRRLSGPSTTGRFHRVVWDLRYPPPPSNPPAATPEGVVRSEVILPALPRPVTPAGPFVAPGTYRVTLEAGTVRVTQRVQVKGDPELPLTEARWEERTRFLRELLAHQRDAFDATRTAASLRDTLALLRDRLPEDSPERPRASARADTARARAGRLLSLQRRLYQLAAAFNGNGVRQGTLYPPTETHQTRLRLLTGRLRDERALLREMTTWVPDAPTPLPPRR